MAIIKDEDIAEFIQEISLLADIWSKDVSG